jgi:hypothetical protein
LPTPVAWFQIEVKVKVRVVMAQGRLTAGRQRKTERANKRK